MIFENPLFWDACLIGFVAFVCVGIHLQFKARMRDVRNKRLSGPILGKR